MFSVVSTFSGCGGSSLGYQMAGGKVLLAVEMDNNAVETYRLNFPDTRIYHGDIAKLSVEECLKLTGLRPGELDIFDGSPPCQGFSTAGKRRFSDERNQLFREYVRLLRGLQPKVFVMENVSGMVKGQMKLIFAEILQELKASGYKVKARLLNAKYFSVPQSRERLIFIGVREDLGIEPSHPVGNKRVITVREAFAGLKSNEMDCEPLTPLFVKYWNESAPGKSMGKYNSTRRLHPNRCAPTLAKTEPTGGSYHYSECRRITTSERKALASFPESFQFLSFRSATERIGNSVPPKFMQAIAEHIRDNILNRVNQTTHTAR